MKKADINGKLRDYVRANISLNASDRSIVVAVYDAFKRVLNNECIQIGSYPRFTAIKPLHDLDILYFLGPWDETSHDPSYILRDLHGRIRDDYENPTEHEIYFSLQSHSVSISFQQSDIEVFSVDVVPAYMHGKNEFGQDMFMVPELVRRKRGEGRKEFYKTLATEHRQMQWIASDPRGYIEIATRMNGENPDFRRTVKFAKAWNNACKELNDDFPLKSFHIEQLITLYYQAHRDAEIFDGVFEFFLTLPDKILSPEIIDRADSSMFIDSYLQDLKREQRDMVRKSRDHFLKSLEEMSDGDPIDVLLDVQFYQRVCASEEYLFDRGIPVLTDGNYNFKIMGNVQERHGGFRGFILNAIGRIPIDRKINFKIEGTPPAVDMFKWKVKNDDNSPEPRGEITDHHTRNDPEHTKYIGNHYVECYAILDDVCVAKARQNVKLGD